MARRSHVMRSPPGEAKRRAMVVREGPPKRDRRSGIDVAIGVAGIVLLILMVALFSILTPDEPVPPQYEVTFAETLTDAAAQDASLAEGDTVTLDFDYEGGNLYGVVVAFEWADDIAASAPDTFEITLLDPEGNVVAGPVTSRNLDPEVQPGQPRPTYSAVPQRGSLVAELAPRPTTQVVEDTEGVGEEAILAQAEAEHARGGDGTWQVQVTLVEAGDCPDPSGLDFSRYSACVEESGDTEDPGNPFTVTLVTFTKYDPIVRPL